jgi:hypothetical protein|tara:strand:- start:269 stop:820 length:552 start_codon:yes stop_codon:yes gene_type:complete
MIQGDSIEYELLTKWSKDFDCKGYYSCEIGVREGLGSKIIMDNVKNNYMHIGIDPYGDLEYKHYDSDKEPYRCDYTDEMRDRLLTDFAGYKAKFHLANMFDSVFMSHPDNQGKKFMFVHFDGPHMTRDVLYEAIWFANRAASGCRFVFDDYPKYNMQLISDAVKPFGFKVLEQGKNKICLEKM